MKILFISNGYPPRQWAGTETYTAGLAQELFSRGHSVQILCGGDWQEGSAYFNGYSDEVYHGVAVRRLNLNWQLAPDPFQFLYRNPVTADLLADYLIEIQPDLVHVTSCDILSASVLHTVKNADLPLVLSLVDFWFLCPRWNLLRSDGEYCDGITTAWECLRCMLFNEKAYRLTSLVLPEPVVTQLLTTISKYPLLTRKRGLRGMAGDMADRKEYLRQALSLPDYRITASSFVRDVFIANGIDGSINVQAYGHDLSWLDGYEGKTPSKEIRIGFIGQITASKGVSLLLQAVLCLQEEYCDVITLSIYGNMEHQPGYSSHLVDLAEGRHNIRFCGTYLHEQGAAVFANIDILVVPSLWYDFPLVIHEAFATKTPVIATDLGGMAETVTHDVNGLLFERDNVDNLAMQLKRIVEEPGLLTRLQSGINPVKTIQEEVTELEAIYQELTFVD